MANRYQQTTNVSGQTRFVGSPEASPEFSRFKEATHVVTAFNTGCLVPVDCIEVLPNQSIRVDSNDIVRTVTMKLPTMGELYLDMYAFFVPNRIVNDSWKNVMGENTSGSWTASDVTLAPLYMSTSSSSVVQIPVGSVADFYGIPPQDPMHASTLADMNDLPLRGYLAIHNEYFRDQNFTPPIPFSRLNVYEGFLQPAGTSVGLSSPSSLAGISVSSDIVSDGSFATGSLQKAVYGEGSKASDLSASVTFPARKTSWSALDPPLKVNRLHDVFSSVLPSPQKGPAVTFSLAGTAPVTASWSGLISGNPSLGFSRQLTPEATTNAQYLSDSSGISGTFTDVDHIEFNGTLNNISGTADLSEISVVDINQLRNGIAMQQLYELLGRSGSRYRSLVASLFGLDVDDPFMDVPQLLGHRRYALEVYQTAQTSESTYGSSGSLQGSPQGNLAAFSYTNKGSFLFHETFKEHGFVHIFVTVRQKNLYPSYLAPHWFRKSMLDFYNPILANIGEQPVYLRHINPFGTNADSTVFGYQEAWWDYRQHPDIVTGVMRSGVEGSLSAWTYQDVFDSSQSSADASFMESNAQEVVDNTLAITSANEPQILAEFTFTIEQVFPGPVFSVPGLDTI